MLGKINDDKKEEILKELSAISYLTALKVLSYKRRIYIILHALELYEKGIRKEDLFKY